MCGAGSSSTSEEMHNHSWSNGLGRWKCPSASITNAAKALAAWCGQLVPMTATCLPDLGGMIASYIDALDGRVCDKPR